MKKFYVMMLAIVFFTLSGCNSTSQNINNNKQITQPSKSTPTPTISLKPTIDLKTVQPNESGKIMVVMFHNFVESFTPTKWDNGEYTTTFDKFESLLDVLYNKGYRLISLKDYLNNNISVEASCIPMLFTFDDGTSGQFNLIKEGGMYSSNTKSAVGIMEKFNKVHPDFGLKGVFFINPGLKVFEGEGNISDRLKYLTAKGFEIGNHTMTHISLKSAPSAQKIEEEIGKSDKKVTEWLPGYKMYSLALPFGETSDKFSEFIVKGNYEGNTYENLAIMHVGWDPAYSPVSKYFTPLALHRVRATGIKKVDTDLDWWLNKLSRNEQYISDGDADKITIPISKEKEIAKDRLKNKKLITY